jgi:hypothetical protein
MIQRLITSLQALAAPAEAQLARFPDFVAKADELALDFDDALMLIRDCPQLELTGDQVTALDAVDHALAAMSGPAQAGFWTEVSLRESLEWARVRSVAAEALGALGAPVESPPPRHGVYVRGLRPGA